MLSPFASLNRLPGWSSSSLSSSLCFRNGLWYEEKLKRQDKGRIKCMEIWSHLMGITGKRVCNDDVMGMIVLRYTKLKSYDQIS